jgi:hypothetical protein
VDTEAAWAGDANSAAPARTTADNEPANFQRTTLTVTSGRVDADTVD